MFTKETKRKESPFARELFVRTEGPQNGTTYPTPQSPPQPLARRNTVHPVASKTPNKAQTPTFAFTSVSLHSADHAAYTPAYAVSRSPQCGRTRRSRINAGSSVREQTQQVAAGSTGSPQVTARPSLRHPQQRRSSSPKHPPPPLGLALSRFTTPNRRQGPGCGSVEAPNWQKKEDPQ